VESAGAQGEIEVIACNLNGVRRILCLGAHSDDIEIGCGGTLLSLIAASPAI
jgi:LmbE family N-acetylglucosaminyl deacetylase